ncbi:adenylate/guanylate cyclase domain-containing protein [Chitinimonas arctica]|uniref:Adenylate/guanylate cyclase domain-containing protein n=1 Tax=Chitinimonas arctica TaxID=2594795 RepID=A0A516SKT1_9NEIS|nr:adenylate/guanylate cyclase domain-containing protein [Chitinimonas arctica]QDQ28760.1 adenylate/guanylate cyclase domain-containing protein [Chitinimonas arctica]
MADADELAQWLARRRLPGADKAGIDAAIFARFGRTQAVMFTDLVGFSYMAASYGIVEGLQLVEASEALFLPLVAQHGGQCLKREGDSLLVLFDHALPALSAARAMVAASNAAGFEVCIGLGYGDLLRIGEHEVWGAEVNAASKLGEDLACGGEVLFTHDFRLAVPQVAVKHHGLLCDRWPVYRLSDT